jgi:3-hydroxybutyryl-CoA dehydratase
MSTSANERASTTSAGGGERDSELCWSHYFDQLAVGQRFSGGERRIHDSDVVVFSALTGDWHPQHCDPDWAASSIFGERIAHGLLVLSMAVGAAPLHPERVLALRRVCDVVFKRPVRFEDTISTEGEIAKLKPVDDGCGLVTLDWTIRNQSCELVARAKFDLLWRRHRAAVGSYGVGPFWHREIVGPDGGFMPFPL